MILSHREGGVRQKPLPSRNSKEYQYRNCIDTSIAYPPGGVICFVVCVPVKPIAKPTDPLAGPGEPTRARPFVGISSLEEAISQ